MDEIRDLLRRIYGARQGMIAFERIARLIDAFDVQPQQSNGRFSQNDVVLITYGDSLLNDGQTPLQALGAFARQHLKESFSAIHFLPFFPFSSDDGFSVEDFFCINPAVGSWEDVERLRSDFDLMIDYVLNHVSAKSRWVASYLAEEPGYEDLAIEVLPQTDLSAVTRPRALPLLTPFTKGSGEKVHLWTTFSADQIDLNYKSIHVLVKMVEVLLFYISKGARLLRMDAVAYLWKEIGTTCIHLKQTHWVVRLLRRILDRVAPDVIIITETNVPHAENISYFGDGLGEAQMVYNFTLPPLLLHTFAAGDATILSQWAQGLGTPTEATTFFNFTASHDGIGVRPLEGILPHDKMGGLARLVQQSGGLVSYKQNSDGSKSPYELNITYVDALGGEPSRFLASQAVQMILPGVPAVYIHSLLGSRNWQAGVAQTGRARTINRERLELRAVLDALDDPNSFRSRIFYPYAHMLKTRRRHPAFHPNAGFEVLPLDRRIFAVKRYVENQVVYALTNISGEAVTVSLEPHGALEDMRDLLCNQKRQTAPVVVQPYESLWLSAQ